MESTIQWGGLVGFAASLAWWKRHAIKDYLVKFWPSKPEPAAESEESLIVSAVRDLESARSKAKQIGNEKAARCIRSASQSLFDDEAKDVEK